MRSRLLCAVTAGLVGLGTLVGLTLGTAAPASAAAQVFPVPTSNAGLGRITTAPNGDMWFVEEEANKIGRITATGAITEFAVPASSDVSQVQDLDVAPDGSVWVTHDSGRNISRYSGSGQLLATGELSDQFGDDVVRPYGGDVRVDPGGTVWITMNFDESFVTRVVGGQTLTQSPNSPECDDVLGEAANGSMWCADGPGIVALNADASGGTTFPVGVGASNPRTLAAGPVGSIWFGNHQSGSFAFPPSTGEVGYLNGATPVRFNTGERTAPADLVRGPDNSMWFTSIGAAKGIGHVDASGRGALTQVGGYAPTSLTFGPDGAVWFTDATNNVIVRVPTSDLQVTNVDPGEGSVFTQGAVAGGGLNAGRIQVQAGRQAIRARGAKVPLTLSCPRKAAGGCTASLTLRTAKKVRAPGAGKKAAKAAFVVSKPVSVRIKAGKRKTVTAKLTKPGAKVVRRGTTTQLRVLLDGGSAKKISVRR